MSLARRSSGISPYHCTDFTLALRPRDSTVRAYLSSLLGSLPIIAPLLALLWAILSGGIDPVYNSHLSHAWMFVHYFMTEVAEFK